jgi:hypothetical protein
LVAALPPSVALPRAAEVERKAQIVRLDRLLQRLQRDAGLHHRNALNRIDHLDGAHPFRRNDHLFGRHVGPVNETREAALGHDSQPVVMAPANGF